MSEGKKVLGPIMKYLDRLGIFYLRNQSGRVKVRGGWMNLAPQGTADLVIFPDGKLPIWVECKVTGNKTSKERQQSQAEFAETVRRLGHTAIQATCLDDVLAVLNE